MTAPVSALTFGRTAPTITVTDIDRALRFYRDSLGMTVDFTNGEPVGFVILVRDAAEVHLTLSRAHRASDRNVMHLMVSDAQALHDALAATGARIVKGVRDEEYGLRDFVVADPDGNRIDIGQLI